MALMMEKEDEVEEDGGREERERVQNEGFDKEVPWRKGVEREVGLDEERERGGLRREKVRDIVKGMK